MQWKAAEAEKSKNTSEDMHVGKDTVMQEKSATAATNDEDGGSSEEFGTLDLGGLVPGMMVVAAAEKEENGDSISIGKLMEKKSTEEGMVKWYTRKSETRKYYDYSKGQTHEIELETIVYLL